MDYDILPLAITQPEWSTFIMTCQDVAGISPIRGLDACHLKKGDPASFLASLNMENKPLKSLRQTGPWFEHYMVSFLMVLDEEAVLLLTKCPIKTYWKEARKHKYLAIVSGNMSEWHRTILFGCSESSDYILRWIMNRVLARFEQAGFREIFTEYRKTQLQDGTFTLKS